MLSIEDNKRIAKNTVFLYMRMLLVMIVSLYTVRIVLKALGAEDSVDWVYYKRTQDAVEDLKRDGFEVWAVEQVEGSVMLQDFHPRKEKKYAVILGNEVKGVQQEVVDLCDGCIEVPQFGTKHSLNVSVTAGIIIWEIARKMKL